MARASACGSQLPLDSCPFFVLGCDGVWDVLTDQMAVDAVAAAGRERRGEADDEHGVTRGASALRDLAFLHGSTDNISAMVVDLTALIQRL